jgi:hypothetical protein
MPALLFVVAIVAGIAAYGAACLWLIAFVSTPLALVAAAAGVVGGLGVGVVQATTVLFGGYPRTAVRRPSDVRTKLPPVQARYVRRDRAWPQYFVRQVWLDLQASAQWITGTVVGMWSGAAEFTFEQRWVLWFWPLLFVGAVGMLTFSVGMFAALATLAAVVVLVAVPASAVGLLAILALRGADRTWQAVFHADSHCPRCYENTALPAYRCKGRHSPDELREGDDLHRDIRPGRLGVWWRRCSCGRRLPTTVLRAAHRLEATCPYCGYELHKGAGVATDVRVPVFGGPSAGKTHLIMSFVVWLVGPHGQPSTSDNGDGASMADDYSRQRYEEYRELITTGQSAPKTEAGKRPVAVTLRIRSGWRHVLLHFFDAAGEALVDPEQNANFAYLDYARTLIFVLDPFSVAEVRDQLAVNFPDLLREANPSGHDPEDSYQSTVSRLRGYGVQTDRKRLAFVVSKQDLLERVPLGEGLHDDPESVRNWLVSHGLDNLVTAAQRDFREVRYFLVTSTDPSGAGAVAPLLWLLEQDDVKPPRQRPDAKGKVHV